MPRVTAVHRPADYPGEPDAATRQALATLFGTLFPGAADPAFDGNHAGMAIAAQSPALALQLARTSGVIVTQLGWSQRTELRELVIQAVNRHYASDYSFDARVAIGEAAGITAAQQRALGEWRTSRLFDDEQRLVLEYVEAVLAGTVPDALFARLRDRYGEAGTIECTALVAFFAFWAMFLNATGPELRPLPRAAG